MNAVPTVTLHSFLNYVSFLSTYTRLGIPTVGFTEDSPTKSLYEICLILALPFSLFIGESLRSS